MIWNSGQVVEDKGIEMQNRLLRQLPVLTADYCPIIYKGVCSAS